MCNKLHRIFGIFKGDVALYIPLAYDKIFNHTIIHIINIWPNS